MFDDLRLAVRGLRRAPGFALAAVVTVALAVGANTAVLSIADAVMFRPLPYREPHRVFILQMANRETGARFTSIRRDVLAAIASLEPPVGETAVAESDSFVAVGDSGAELIPAATVSANYFELLGIRPAVGRNFSPLVDAPEMGTAMLSFASWQQRFGGRPDIIGQEVSLGTTVLTVVGVLPSDFVFPHILVGRPEVIRVMPRPSPTAASAVFNPVLRLRDGVTVDHARAVLAAISAASPKTANTAMLVIDEVHTVLYPVGRVIMQLLLAAATLVLLIGCANLANLLSARNRQNEREMGIRAALGASATRMARPHVFEALLLGVTGSALAVACTALSFDSLRGLVPPSAYREAPIGVSLRVVAISIALGLVAGLLFALVPAWRATRLDVKAIIDRRTTLERIRASRAGRPLVAIQIAAGVVLLFASFVVGRAFLKIVRVPLGFDAGHVVALSVSPAELVGPQGRAFYERAVERLASNAFVTHAGAVQSLPFAGAGPDDVVISERDERPIAAVRHVLPGFFETVGVAALRGRVIRSQDAREHTPAAVITESAARTLFGITEPLGQRIKTRLAEYFVVGIVPDMIYSLGPREMPVVFALAAEPRVMTLVAHVATRDETTVTALKRQIAELAPTSPIRAAWWQDTVNAHSSYRNPRFQAVVLGAFALLAITLSTLGVMSVITFAVATRRHELGVRLAVGATPKSIVYLTLRYAVVPVVVGIGIAIVASPTLARLAEAQNFPVDAGNPGMLASAAAVIGVAALVAAWIPARRAGKIDPLEVLRSI